MKYLKENTNSVYSYKDFLRNKKVLKLINDKEENNKINSLEGIAESYPYVEDLEISNSNVTDFSPLSNMKNLKTLTISSSPLINLNNLNNLDLDDLVIDNCLNFKEIGTIANINVNKLTIYHCKEYSNVNNNIIFNNISLSNIKYLKDLMFLKHLNVRKISLSNIEIIDSLNGIQYIKDTDLIFYGGDGTKNSFLYHDMFYENIKKHKKLVKDYWKEVLEYWIDSYGDDWYKQDEKELNIFLDELNLPDKDKNRLFPKEEMNKFKSRTSINKFKL